MTDENFVTMDDESDVGGPHGLLMWGQAGIFNSPDDRLVIAALSDSVHGIVKPAILTPGPGLTISVAAGWLGIANCGDGTNAVAGSRLTHVLTPDDGIQAGPVAGGARRDLLWCDVHPDDAVWRLSVIREPEALGRPGLPLATITCPQGSNLASQFQFSEMVPTFGSHAEGVVRANTGTALMTLTPHYPIAPPMIRPRSQFRLRAYGWGRFGAVPHDVRFRIAHASSPHLYFSAAGQFQAGMEFSWQAEAVIQVRQYRPNIMINLSATISRGQGQGALGGNYPSLTATRCTNVTTWNPDEWSTLQVQGAFTQNSSNQIIEGVGSSFETIEPY